MKDISISAIADTLDHFRLMDDPYEWHDNEGVESTKDIAEHLFDNEYRNAVVRELVLDMAYDWSGKGLDFLYKRGWIAIRNPSMGNTFLDMDETRTATKAQVNTIFDYINKYHRYDMNVSKVMAD